MSISTAPDGRVSELQDFGFDTLSVPELPTLAPVEMIVVVKVVGLPEDFHEDAPRNAEAYLVGPGPDPLSRAEALIALDFEIRAGEPSPDHPDGWEANTVIPLLMRFTPQHEGHHLFEFYVNGRAQKCFIPLRILLERPEPSN